MDKMLLSLKNIYRLFMVQDFPVYSESIFSEKNRRGLTLVKFWLTYLAEDFRTGQYGKMIWRSEGKRNRHISAVINRSGVQSAYHHYEAECVRILTIQVLEHQQELFMKLLKDRAFSLKAFLRKVGAYLERLDEDPYFNRAADIYLRECYEKIEEKCRDEDSGTFYCAWMLTLLTVFALAGSRMGMLTENTCRAGDFMKMMDAGTLYKKGQREFRFLTKQTGELSKKPLPKQHFFGREREVFELQQMVIHGGHYLISGMGGIGKTELLRQLLQICIEEKLCDAVALISYENSIAMSFVTAFGEIGALDLNTKYMEILGRIRLFKDTKILILIDNMNYTALKDKGLKALLDLPATILAASRVREIPGFTTFEIKSLSADAGSLIFRDYYGKRLTDGGKKALSKILSIESSRHPLTLRFLGKTASFENWSVEEIKEQFVKDSGRILMKENQESVFLGQVYDRVYQLNHLSYKARCLLDVYTKLPYMSYSASFLHEFFMEAEESIHQAERSLKTLCWMGFLENSKNGFAMHPFIAECLGRRSVERKEYFFERLLENISLFFDKTVGTYDVSDSSASKTEVSRDVLSKYLEGGMLMDTFAKSPELGETCRILLHYEKNMTVKERSKRQIGILLLAIEAVGRIYGFSEDMYIQLAHFRQTYAKLPFSWRVRCLIMEAYNENLSADEYEGIFDEYAQHMCEAEISEELYEYFCMAYIKILRHGGKVDEVLAQCEELYGKIKNKRLKIEVSRHIISMFIRKRNYSEIAQWIDESEKLMSSETDMETYREFLMQKGRYYFFTEQWDLFQKIQAELCQSIKEKDIRWQYEYFYWQGITEIKRNQNEQAAVSLKSARDYARAYFGKNHTTVAYVAQAIGVALCNIGQYEEAFFYTQEAYDIFAHYPGELFMRRALKNNIGYLAMTVGKLKEASVCFTELYDELRTDLVYRDVVLMAQVSDNLAKIFHVLQKQEEEKRWLVEAIGHMEEAFGAEHDLTKDAKARLCSLNL